MATHAILNIGDAFFAVLARDTRGIVLVAAIAGVGFEIARQSMASGARDPAPFAVIERERVLECRAFPRRGSMALNTVGAKLTAMHLRFRMAGHTRLWRAFEDVVDMALGAGHIDVRADQLENRQVVIELGLFPIFGRMALAAICAVCALVLVILTVAVHARLRRAFQDAIHVTLVARHWHMLAHQLERRQVVIKLDLLPILRRMALGAIRAERTLVLVILAMTFDTRLRRAFEHSVRMTLGARHLDMFADQLEGRLVVIKLDLLPICG